MAKKSKLSKAPLPSKNHLLSLFFICSLTAIAVWFWTSDTTANWKDQLMRYIDNQEIATLETKFLPEQIIQTHRQELLDTNKKTIRNTVLKYYPYLLLDIKYTAEDGQPREGFVLWGMTDGEIVLNTETWEQTHGFKDCLECKASRYDFKILQALAKNQGKMTVDVLQKELQLEHEAFLSAIQAAKENHLIVQTGNLLKLHFENPKLLTAPQSKINQQIVFRAQTDGIKVARTYSKNQIIEMAKAAFGNDFKIRKEEEIFLPVYAFEILNPDGSVQVSEWNALTGKPISPRYLMKGQQTQITNYKTELSNTWKALLK